MNRTTKGAEASESAKLTASRGVALASAGHDDAGAARLMIWSYGHGTASQEEIVQHLHAARIEVLVDVRSYPGSRRNPHVGREQMARWIPQTAIDYVWLPSLGGRRKMTADAERDVVWRHPSFRAYAGHMRTAEFAEGIDRLLDLASGQRVAFMCSESVWWKCHRRMISDFLTVARGVDVRHLMHDGRAPAHAPTEGYRLVDGLLVYDGGQARFEVAV